MKNSAPFTKPRRPSFGAPKHLSAEARRRWKQIAIEYRIVDDAGRLILTSTFEAFDRLRACQAAIAKEGQTFTDRFGQPRPHPLLAPERDARAAMIHGLKALGLDVEPVQERPSRPTER